MKIVPLQQGSKEWLRWRENRITATDAATILGLNPWKEPWELWEEKLGMRPPTVLNDAMRRGQELEPIARNLFVEEMGIQMNPVCVEHDKDWWHGSSLDGIDSSGKIIQEIKCPKLATHKQAIEGIIPIYYQCQMQHQFYDTGAEICYYTSYYPKYTKELMILEVFPDWESIEEMVNMEWKFYEENLCQMRSPLWTM